MADFIQTLMEMRAGAAAADCSRKLSELVAAIMETGKKGELVLKVNITPSRLNLGRVTEVEIEHTCKISKPEHSTGRSIFFTTEEGTLTREDPNQMAFEITEERETNGRR